MAKTIGQLTAVTTFNPSTDEFVIEQSGQTFKVAASVVRGGLVNANIDAAAAIAFSKLAALDSANILVGNGSNVATKVAVTGDVTISNAGVTAIGSAKVLPAMLSQPYTLATAQASTSGTSIDFTSIPSWANRITVSVNSVSTSGTSPIIVQIGAGSFLTTGYTGSTSTTTNAGAGVVQLSTGFPISVSNSASSSLFGSLTLIKLSGNDWNASGSLGAGNEARTYTTGGSVSLSGALDRVRITTVNGTDTFDAGTINISYEG